jgi:hypothetical protein
MGPKIDFFKKALLPHKSDEENAFQEVRIAELRQMTYDRIAKEEASGNLDAHRAEQMVEILNSEVNMLKQGVSFGEVKHELARKLDNHCRHHSKKGFLSSGDDEHKMSDDHRHPGVMPYNRVRE